MKPPTQEIIISDPAEALRLLMEGNERFISAKLSDKRIGTEKRVLMSEKQRPFAVILCCSDSRVSPEIIFDQNLSDIFVIRNAGNIVDTTVLGSVEYAVSHLGVSLIVVVGHSNCGAVTAACGGGAFSPELSAILSHIKPSKKTVNETAREHAKDMANRIEKALPVLNRDVLVKPAYYDIASGQVTLL